ncbi:MAG TPA: class I SAM-dependent methyltransferase, partial [Stellaceae bacterium]|nr:class I SAM-dependent methyltransferase [Stellaceae bacterium]
MPSDNALAWGRGAPGRRGRERHPSETYVAETRIGTWFLGTEVWAEHVLERAIKDLVRLMGSRRPTAPTIVDIGCGWGRSFALLDRHLGPRRLIGIDRDAGMLAASAEEIARRSLSVELINASSSRLPLADASADIVFCHQTFHHLVDQEAAIAEFYRVLKPAGLLLFAESTRAYIESWIIRLLFRHPMDVQKTAAQYVALIRGAGFRVDADAISLPYLWWSRADLGLKET